MKEKIDIVKLLNEEDPFGLRKKKKKKANKKNNTNSIKDNKKNIQYYYEHLNYIVGYGCRLNSKT